MGGRGETDAICELGEEWRSMNHQSGACAVVTPTTEGETG